MLNLFNQFLLKILQLRKKRSLKQTHNRNIPILKFKSLKTKINHSEHFIQNIFPKFKISRNELDQIITVHKKLNKNKSHFNELWYQCGGLEEEIFLVYFLLTYFKPKNILEIGVANGFSSAFLVHYAKKKNVQIDQIDLPKISTQFPIGLSNKIIHYLSKNNLIVNNENLYDLRNGGVVPHDKYQGWLIEKKDFLYKKRKMFIGNASKLLPMINEKYDFILVDAMKDQKSRLDLLTEIYKKSKSKFCVIQDGGWVNDAFKNFCIKKKLKLYSFGKIQFTFRK